METSLLRSFRSEEEQFVKTEYDDLYAHISQAKLESIFRIDFFAFEKFLKLLIFFSSINGQLTHSSPSESAEEDYERTLNDWDRHVGSVPVNTKRKLNICIVKIILTVFDFFQIMDSDDYSDNDRLIKYSLDLLEYSSKPNKCIESEEPLIKIENGNCLQISDVDYDVLTNSDSRLIDNDNASHANMISDIINPLDSSCNLLDSFDSKFLEYDQLNNIFDSDKNNEVNSEIGNINCLVDNSQQNHPRGNIVQKFSPISQIHKKYISTAKNKRNKQKSISLPQSPEHDAFGLDGIDLQSSFCFEDIEGVDINSFVDNDINIAPEKAFNKSFDISDVLNDERNDLSKKGVDESVDLFGSEIQYSDLDTDIKDFDLPSFIMGKSNDDSSNFFIDCLQSNQTDNKVSDKVDEPENYATTLEVILEQNSNELSSVPVLKLKESASPKNKPELTPKVSKQKNSKRMVKRAKSAGKDLSIVSAQFQCTESKMETDDYIDVESVSDNESVPVIAANNVDSLLEQFEATEDFSKSIKNVKKTNIQKKVHPAENNNNISKEPHLAFPKVRTVDSQKSLSTKNNLSQSVGAKENRKVCISLSNQIIAFDIFLIFSMIFLFQLSIKKNQEHVRLDHDYCLSLERTGPRIFSKSAVSLKFEHCGKSEDNSEFVDLSSYYLRSQNSNMSKKQSPSCINNNEKNSENKSNAIIKINKTNISKTKKNIETTTVNSPCNQNLKTVNSLKIENSQHSSSNGKSIHKNTLKMEKIDNSKRKKDNNKKDIDESQNLLVYENRNERFIDINRDAENILTVNKTFNCNFDKNSLVITKLKSQSEEKSSQKEVKKINICKSNVNRLNYGMLKPFLKDKVKVKMVSLLKSNYCGETDALKNQDTKMIEKLNSEPANLKTKAIQIKNVSPVKVVNIDIGGKSTIIRNSSNLSQKRKLNIEEYKKRREGGNNSCDSSRTCSPVGVFDNEILSENNANTKQTCVNETLFKEMHNVNGILTSENVIKSTNINKDNSKLFDPIADATRKALKMRKKLSHVPNEEKIIKSKIANVENVVILPLATENGKLLPMIKTIDKKEIEVVPSPPIVQKEISEYDEVVTVCIGINTDLDNTREMVVESVKNDKPNETTYIRENKTITYLKKDRIKIEMHSMSTQTDCIDETSATHIELHTFPNSEIDGTHIKRERRDSSMSISGESNCDKNYTDLINRWKNDANKKSSDQLSHTSNASLHSNRSKTRSKKKYRKRYESQSSSSSEFSAKYKRRSRSYSGDRKNGKNSKLSSLYRLKDIDNRSTSSLSINPKRKRNFSTSSDDRKDKTTRHKFKTSRPPNKMAKDYDGEHSEVESFCKNKLRSLSVSSQSSCSSRSDSDSSSVNSRSSSTASSYR